MAAVLHTSAGDLPVLLHFQTCPLAAFNFLALCASGYYDGCTFYRHFPGVLLQTGDPTNTGKGGESVFAKLPGPSVADDAAVSAEAEAAVAAGVREGRYFPDEGFGATTHAQRGTLSMAHRGTKADTNASQFFVTTSPQPSFDGVYTAFGVVDLHGVYSAATSEVIDAAASAPDAPASDSPSSSSDTAAAQCGDDVLRALEAAAADVDAKGLVQNSAQVRILRTTVLYNPFAEGKMRL
ncbi:cyclophilin 7 [Novymonas esmeraldas]|uniref:Cyclophilin 7 n=1 Tax=Novymonas esmeraldas TaxID=1808958 RepID=A0AAW0F6E4_9TRYP